MTNDMSILSTIDETRITSAAKDRPAISEIADELMKYSSTVRSYGELINGKESNKYELKLVFEPSIPKNIADNNAKYPIVATYIDEVVINAVISFDVISLLLPFLDDNIIASILLEYSLVNNGARKKTISMLNS